MLLACVTKFLKRGDGDWSAERIIEWHFYCDIAVLKRIYQIMNQVVLAKTMANDLRLFGF